ncbi:MAG: 4Fe-4S binding protein [Planctomycetes bacterium]|nr:4Fe-4S binding protein [Planctomycetota bacterium]
MNEAWFGGGRSFAIAHTVCVALLFLLLDARSAQAQVHYERPVETAPSEEDIGEGYQTPEVQRPLPRPPWREVLDVSLLVTSLALASYLVLKRRSRLGIFALTIGCLAWFGFVREGCVCPIGAIQNVALALSDASYTVPIVLIVIFFTPLLFALFFGRVFCGGICPLGAIQEVVLLRPIQVPRRLDRALSLFKWIYLALAVWFVLRPAVDRDFVICRFDPFVSMFRGTGFLHLFLIGGGLLLLGTVVGRPYCRYLCPYGVLLSIVSRVSWRGVSITPGKEVDCGLCTNACPYGAIEQHRAVRHKCLFCARCYRACPYEYEGKVMPEEESR